MSDENVYYNPEAFGLSVVAEIDYSSQSYEFDTRVVWKGNDGKFYTARDSGCSCPTPFEDYLGLEDLDRADLDALRAEIRYELSGQYTAYITPEDGQEFIRAVENAMKEAGNEKQ
jgi:hypothetical protein